MLLRHLGAYFPAESSFRKFIAGLWNRVTGSQAYVGVKINTQTLNLIPQYRSITRDHEPPVWFAIENILRDANCFLDVGANIGIYSLLAAKTMQPKATILSFEPYPSAFALLKKHVAFNRGNVTPILTNAAIYDGSVAFVGIIESPDKIADPESQISFMDTEKPKTTPCLSLDSLTLPDERILIKIDVEGAETGVLRGARNTLKTHREVALILAVHPQQLANFGETIQSLQEEINLNKLMIMDMVGNPVNHLVEKLNEYICTNSPQWYETLSKLMAGRTDSGSASKESVKQ